MLDRSTYFGMRLMLYACLALAVLQAVRLLWQAFHYAALDDREGDLVVLLNQASQAFFFVADLGVLALAMVGCGRCFGAAPFAWAQRFAATSLVAFGLALLVVLHRILYWLEMPFHFVPPGAFTGLLLIGSALFLYYLLAIDAGDAFPANVDARGGRVLFVPLFPAVAGVYFLVGSVYGSIQHAAVLAAALFVALSLWNRLPPDAPGENAAVG